MTESKIQELAEKAKTFVIPGLPGIHALRKRRKMERKNRKAGRKRS